MTPYQSQTTLYTPNSEQKIKFTEGLKLTNGNWFEGEYWLGAEAQVPLRLVAQRVAPQQAETQGRQVKRAGYKGAIYPPKFAYNYVIGKSSAPISHLIGQNNR